MDVRVRYSNPKPDENPGEFIDIDHVGVGEGEFQAIEWVKIDDNGWLLVTISRGYTAKVDGGSGCPPSLEIIPK